MVTKQRVILLGLASVTILVWGAAILRHSHHLPDNPHDTLRKVDPVLSTRIEQQISTLKQETLPRSVERLSDVNMFSWPGYYPNMGLAYGLPLHSNQDKDTVATIMSNRRFRKVLADLSGLDKPKAVQILGGQLSNAITVYLPLYADQRQLLTERFKLSDIDTNHSRGGLSFINGTTNGAVVLLGARLDILSLTWICGSLELHELKQQVDAVVKLALRQREDIYALNSVDPLAREQVLYTASLYNRQILGYALLGVTEKSPARDEAFNKSKLEVQQGVLVSFDAALTEYDLPVKSGVMKPDRSSGTVTVRYFSPTTDTVFDDLSRALMALP